MLPFSLPEHLPCLVAFSGGADSRLLLELTVRALVERNGEEGRGQLTAAHLHHGIRGEEADRDLAFCRRVCRELGVELISERVDVPALAAERGESLETAARRVRYSFFERVMDERGIPTLMTAHHADDNLETILERLLRGTGTRGMGGIPPTRLMGIWNGFPATVLYRPLLEWTRRDILAACHELGLEYITDSSNLADDCTRNRIRHTVIPALEAIAGIDAPQRAALRMSRIAEEDDECLSSMAERRVNASEAFFEGGIELTELRELHPAVAKRAFMRLHRTACLFHSEGEIPGNLAAVHLDALQELARKGIPESTTPLPDGMMGLVRDGFLFICPAKLPPPPPLPEEPISLVEAITAWGRRVCITLESFPSPEPPLAGRGILASAVFPADLPRPLTIRKRQDGDRILSHGMHKRLKKLLQEKNIPPHLRDSIPLICLPDGDPLWYPSIAFRDGYPPPTEGACLRITVEYRYPTRLEK